MSPPTCREGISTVSPEAIGDAAANAARRSKFLFIINDIGSFLLGFGVAREPAILVKGV